MQRPYGYTYDNHIRITLWLPKRPFEYLFDVYGHHGRKWIKYSLWKCKLITIDMVIQKHVHWLVSPFYYGFLSLERFTIFRNFLNLCYKLKLPELIKQLNSYIDHRSWPCLKSIIQKHGKWSASVFWAYLTESGKIGYSDWLDMGLGQIVLLCSQWDMLRLN